MKKLLSTFFGGSSMVAMTIVAACSSGAVNNAADGTSDGDGGAALGDGTPDASGDADPYATCKGVDFESDGTYDVDLQAVHVGGRVTVDGAKADATHAGRITFTASAANGASGRTSAPIKADDQYEATLAPGTYDIGYEPDTHGCMNGGTPGAWPCNARVLQKGVVLTADGVFDLDLTTVLVEGKITLEGHAFPPFGPILTFSETSGASAVTIPAPTQKYQARLFPGTYDVGYAHAGPACDTFMPCNSGVINPGVNLTKSGVLDVDVPMVVARGSVSLDGTKMSGTTRGGSVTFSSSPAKTAAKNLWDGASASIGTDGNYALALLPGTYAIGYSGVPNAPSGSPLPRSGGIVLPSVPISNDGTLDVDVKTASVNGKVTVNGAPILASESAALSFTTTGGEANISILPNGTYSAILVVGNYDVGFAPSSCTTNGSLPCNGGKLRTVSLSHGGGALDIDLPVVTIEGKVTLNGGSLPVDATASITFAPPASKPSQPIDPNDPSQRGEPSASAVFVDILPDATYTTRLLSGTYDVGYGGAACDDAAMPMPCNAGTLRGSVSLTNSGALDIDIASARVNGRVTLRGTDVPTSTTDRGALSFVGKAHGTATTASFPPSGRITYDTHILRGAYVIVYAADTACSEQPSSLPCTGMVVAGCN
ncbi:hypothetical protein AKJ09_05802 [Labilithrix luteola]|uniref:Uncharacterized protein n=1 Tax=Labilithrix luteola TaxID=1391654 RepID=A0A0K1Q032_9BACT|nr:hypothetical protein [Labilithrix luteola]AKU99138.1 hypothetical protein AKJ09_05802 [Labilithrix luteola]